MLNTDKIEIGPKSLVSIAADLFGSGTTLDFFIESGSMSLVKKPFILIVNTDFIKLPSYFNALIK